jgi:hypothetical protein
MKQQLTELAGAELRRSIVIEIATGDQKKNVLCHNVQPCTGI